MYQVERDTSHLVAALALQEKRKAAGLSRPQMAALLGMRSENYLSLERGDAPITPPMQEKIRETLEGVKTGKLKVEANPTEAPSMRELLLLQGPYPGK